MRPRVKGALLLLLAFVLGGTAGATGLGSYLVRTGGWRPARSEQFQRRVLGRLDRELNLTPAQLQQVEAILRETGEEFARLRQEIRPRYREIGARSRERIREVLDPGQREKFQALAEEWERRAEQRWRRRPEDGRREPGAAGSGASTRDR